MDGSEADHEPLFRANKRRKVFRKRADSEDIVPAAASASGADIEEDEVQSSLTAPPRPQRTGQGKKNGISFSSTGRGTSQAEEYYQETALVHMHPSREQQLVQSDRFVKPTGKVAVADDKHMVAFIDSKLAELRSSIATPVDDASGSTRPPEPLEDGGQGDQRTMAEAQPGGMNRTGGQRPDAANTGMSAVASQRKSQSQRPLARPRRPPPVRDESAVARESLVDQILRESAVPLYDRSTSSTMYKANEGTSNEEAVANAFKEEFLAQAELHKRRKPPAPPPVRGAAPVSNGPKLGGSRSQREKMKAAEEASKAAGGKR